VGVEWGRGWGWLHQNIVHCKNGSGKIQSLALEADPK
jgi:hypothetical protein